MIDSLPLSTEFSNPRLPEVQRLRLPTKSNFSDVLVWAPLLIATLFSKISIPPFGNTLGLSLVYPALIVLFVIGVLTGRVTLDGRRAAFFGIIFGAIGFVHVIREEPFSMFSLIFMMAVSLLYVLNVPRVGKGADESMRFVTNFAAVIAVCGIIQFAAQFLITRRYAFPIENFVPTGILISHWNYLNPLYLGASIFKSNGIFLAEPSFFSQLMAVALIVELSTTKRLPPMVLFVLAMLLSYSGTGLLVLAVSLPVLLIVERRLDIVIGMVGIVLLILMLAVPLRLDVFLDRLSEFNDHRSSGWLRFVGWYSLAQDSLSSDPLRALFGYGAGTFRTTAQTFGSPISEMFHSKILEEYGILGFVAYVGFVAYCIFTAPVHIAIRIAVMMQHFMNGAFAESVTGLSLTLLLLTPRDPLLLVSARGVPASRP